MGLRWLVWNAVVLSVIDSLWVFVEGLIPGLMGQEPCLQSGEVWKLVRLDMGFAILVIGRHNTAVRRA